MDWNSLLCLVDTSLLLLYVYITVVDTNNIPSAALERQSYEL